MFNPRDLETPSVTIPDPKYRFETTFLVNGTYILNLPPGSTLVSIFNHSQSGTVNINGTGKFLVSRNITIINDFVGDKVTFIAYPKAILTATFLTTT